MSRITAYETIAEAGAGTRRDAVLPDEVISALRRVGQHNGQLFKLYLIRVKDRGWPMSAVADVLNVERNSIYTMVRDGREILEARAPYGREDEWLTQHLLGNHLPQVPQRTRAKTQGTSRALSPLTYMTREQLEGIQRVHRAVIKASLGNDTRQLLEAEAELAELIMAYRRVNMTTMDVALGRPFGWSERLIIRVEAWYMDGKAGTISA